LTGPWLVVLTSFVLKTSLLYPTDLFGSKDVWPSQSCTITITIRQNCKTKFVRTKLLEQSC
jgi:hypothetical protein